MDEQQMLHDYKTAMHDMELCLADPVISYCVLSRDQAAAVIYGAQMMHADHQRKVAGLQEILRLLGL